MVPHVAGDASFGSAGQRPALCSVAQDLPGGGNADAGGLGEAAGGAVEQTIQMREQGGVELVAAARRRLAGEVGAGGDQWATPGLAQRLHQRMGADPYRDAGVFAGDPARREGAGEIPDLRRMATMDEDAIVAALVPIRGIGRWTVEMMLMFRLGRPDVLPVDDLGIRKGVQVLDKLDEMPTPKELLARGERWAPFRSYASFYLWRIADAGVQAKAPAKRSQD